MLRLADKLEAFIRLTGHVIALLSFLMVLLTSLVVVERYVFQTGSIAMQETITFMHAALFMLAAAYTLAAGDHVRVDIFYSRMAPRSKALVDICGTLLLLLPFCGFLIWASWEYVSVSWQMQEASQEAGGLPHPFPAVMKSFIPVGCVLLLLQGAVIAIRSVATLRSGDS